MRRSLKRFGALLGLILLAIPAIPARSVRAESAPKQRVEATLMLNFDVVAVALSYNVFGDQNAALAPVSNNGVTGVFGPGTAVNKKVKTTGASTSLTASASPANGPFQGRVVGDLLLFQAPDQAATTLNTLVEYERSISTFTDVNNIVVDSNIDLSAGYTFRYKKLLGGAGANDAAFDVSDFSSFTIEFAYITKNATSVDSILECRTSKFAPFKQVATANYTAVGQTFATVEAAHDGAFSQCRVGWKVNTDTGVNTVSVYFQGVKG